VAAGVRIGYGIIVPIPVAVDVVRAVSLGVSIVDNVAERVTRRAGMTREADDEQADNGGDQETATYEVPPTRMSRPTGRSTGCRHTGRGQSG
jgi:hypothetical protein